MMDDQQTSLTAPLVETLTGRETDILILMAEELSNREIAERLFLELTTVKWYNQQIYGKLGVNKRHDAIARAKALGLLETTPVKHNLPAQTTPFIGRQRELSELAKLLGDDDVRLITVLAPGGMGKTRLALEVAEGQLRSNASTRFPNGVYFVPLAKLTSSDYIVTAIAEATGFQFLSDSREPQQQILDYLSNKQLLLLLDNFEHLLEGAPLVTKILEAAPGARVLATSREKLGLSGETIYMVGGMVFPDWETPEGALEFDAVKLLLQGAKRAKPDFELKADNLKYVARICRLVEGMPLGILLAAAWVEVLSLEEIADEIQGSFDFLTAEMRDVPRRQWSIRAVFEPTWKRLTDEQRIVFMKLSVFRGGCTRKAAHTVTGASLSTLQALVNKALLWRNPEDRYEIHELLRQYAEGKLEESGESDAARDAHCAYYAEAMQARENDLKGGRQLEAQDEIESDFENVRAAWERAIAQKNYDAIGRMWGSLAWFCDRRALAQEGRELFGLAREGLAPDPNEEPHPVWGCLLAIWLEPMADKKLEAEHAVAQAERSLAIAQKQGDRLQIARCLRWLGRSVVEAGDYPRAIELLEESFIRHRELNEKWGMANSLFQLGLSYAYQGDLDNATEYWKQSLELCHEIGDKYGEAIALFNIGGIALSAGEYVEGEQHKREAYLLQHETKNLWGIGISSGNLSEICFLKGDFEQSKTFATEAMEIAIDLGGFLKEEWGDVAALIKIMEENYNKASQLCEESRPFQITNPAYLSAVDYLRAIAACGMEDYATARQSNMASLEFPITCNSQAAMTWRLPVAAIVTGHEGDKKRATELLSLAYNHPKSAIGWLNIPLITRFRADLESELGEDDFNAAWERGKALDLEAAVEELLAEYVEEN